MLIAPTDCLAINANVIVLVELSKSKSVQWDNILFLYETPFISLKILYSYKKLWIFV